MFSTNPGVPCPSKRSLSRVSTLLLALACLLLPACAEEPEIEVTVTVDPVVHTYTLRGEVVSLPDPADPASELRIRHEAISDFKNAKGEAEPMHAMTMSFSPASKDTLDGIAVGDIIVFNFLMHWSPSMQMQADTIEKLPADTELNFD